MSSNSDKNNPRSKGLVDKQRVKCVKFSKAPDHNRTIKSVRSDNLKNTSIRTVSNTDGSVKSCSSSVTGLDLTADSVDRDSIAIFDENTDKHQEVSMDRDETDVFKLAIPELCTSLKIANNLLGAVASAKESRQAVAANSREKNIALSKSKALAVMNVPFEEQVFKNLIALNINNDDLSSGVKIKSKSFERVKDSEPELSDYFRPSFNSEFIVECAPMSFEIDKNHSFDGFSLSTRAKNWESSDS